MNYVDKLRENTVKNSNGMALNVSEKAVFQVYIICELSPKLRKRLTMSGFKPFLDLQGYHWYNESYNSFVQVISLNKLLRDAKLRNKIFFKKLGV